MSLREALLDNFAPEGVTVVQWLNGKPTRDDVINYLQFTADQLNDIKKFLVDTLTEFDKKSQQTFAALRLQSHQIETIMRLTSGGSLEERQLFYKELRRTMSFAEFIDSLVSKRGAYYDKTMREKVEMIRDWNKHEENLPCNFDALQLQSYISDFPAEFSQEEIIALEQDFNFKRDTVTSNIIIGDDVNVERIT